MSVVSVVCCQVEVSASGSSLVQRRPTDCGMSDCDLETSRTRRPYPALGRSTAWVGGNYFLQILQSMEFRCNDRQPIAL